MIQHKPILTDAEMQILISCNPFTLGLSIARLKDFIRQVEKAVVAKLVAEQEPSAFYIHDNKATDAYYTDHAPEAQEWAAKGVGVTALYAHPMPSPSDLSDKTACVSENGESDRELARHQPCGCVICYCENQERCLGCGAKHCGTHDVDEIPNPVYVDHIADASKMVADMYWINPDYPSYTSILDAFDPILSAVDVEIGDQFEVGRAKTLPTLTIEVTELEENGDVKDFKVLSGDHVVDSDKMVTPLAQRKIQTLLDKGEYRVIENATVLVNENGHAAIVNRGGAFYWVDNEALAREFDGAGVGVDSNHIADMRKKVPEGWQLVPKEPTDAMLSCIMGSVGFESFTSWRVSASGRYMDMLATAPKFGDKQ